MLDRFGMGSEMEVNVTGEDIPPLESLFGTLDCLAAPQIVHGPPAVARRRGGGQFGIVELVPPQDGSLLAPEGIRFQAYFDIPQDLFRSSIRVPAGNTPTIPCSDRSRVRIDSDRYIRPPHSP